MPRGPKPVVRYPLGKLCGFVVSTKMPKTVRLSPRPVPCIAWLTPRGSHAAQVVVQIPYQLWDFKHQVQVRRNTKLWAHDEYELANEGDVVRCCPTSARAARKAQCVTGRARLPRRQVRLQESRPLSKNKAHYIDAIVKREDSSISIPDPYPNAHRFVDELLHGDDAPPEGEASAKPGAGETASAA